MSPSLCSHTTSGLRRYGKHAFVGPGWGKLREAIPVPGRDRLPETIYRILKSKGAPDTCYVMGNTPFDQQTLDLKTALAAHLAAPWDTIISCIAGRLAYLHTHETYFDDYLLERPVAVSP